MPFVSKLGNSYRLCLLDTNAISVILKNKHLEGKHFFQRFSPANHVACFSFYSIFELCRSPELFQKFLDFFSVIPIALLKLDSMIIQEEVVNYENTGIITPIMKAFTPLGRNSSYHLRTFIEGVLKNKDLGSFALNWREEELSILESWLANKHNFIPTGKYPNSKDADKYMDLAGLQNLMRHVPDFCADLLGRNIIPDVNKFPSLIIQLYSFYYRLYNPSWRPKPAEVTDVRLTGVIPYVDDYITEKFQANILSQIKAKVPALAEVSVHRIRDLQ